MSETETTCPLCGGTGTWEELPVATPVSIIPTQLVELMENPHSLELPPQQVQVGQIWANVKICTNCDYIALTARKQKEPQTNRIVSPALSIVPGGPGK